MNSNLLATKKEDINKPILSQEIQIITIEEIKKRFIPSGKIDEELEDIFNSPDPKTIGERLADRWLRKAAERLKGHKSISILAKDLTNKN